MSYALLVILLPGGGAPIGAPLGADDEAIGAPPRGAGIPRATGPPRIGAAEAEGG